MKTLRASVKVFFAILTTVAYYIFLILGSVVSLFSSNAFVKLRNKLIRFWAICTSKILGMKILVEGIPPKPPFFLVSNHLSYVDIILFFTQIDVVFVAKQEISSWPIMGYLTKTANTLFIDRTNKRDIPRVNKLIAENLNENHGIIFFPEGTSTKGAEVLPFKPSLLQLPANEEIPVSYASIQYKTKPNEIPAHLAVCWWQEDSPFQKHIWELAKLSGFEAKIVFGERKIQNSNRKILAQKLWEGVNENFTATV